MQFDQTRIAIRERDLPDLLDLALHVTRAHPLALLTAAVAGAAPFALLNAWLLGNLTFVEQQDHVWYVFRLVILVLFELPLAAAPVTLLLGQAMFMERFDAARLIRQAIDSLPQLLVYQVVVRGILMPQAIFWEAFPRELAPVMAVYFVVWWVPYTYWPYLNEVILLERNPLRSNAVSRSTWKRSGTLHRGHYSDFFARLVGCAVIAAGLTVAIWAALWYLRGLLGDRYEFDRAMYTIYLPLALWTAAMYFNIVRFLSYLDLRIRREGWEVELTLRAEADRRTRQHDFAR